MFKNKFESNVLGLQNSDYIAISPDKNHTGSLFFLTLNPLPEDKKIIILSATANEKIYRKLLGDRLVFTDISRVETLGKVEQDNTYSFSKSSMIKEHHLNYAIEQVGDDLVITHKMFKKCFSNPILNFGNCSGIDEYKGRDICVVGTPHLPEVNIFLMAKAMGIKFKLKDREMRKREIEYEGVRFYFFTYNSNDLAMIQCSQIDSQLQQAIGRARILRTSANVKVFSNFPVRKTKE